MQSRRQVSVPALQGWRNTQLKSRKRAFKTERSDDKGAVAVVKNCTSIGLCLTRFRGIRTSEKNDVSGKTESKSFAINSTDTIDTVYATSSKYPRKKRTIAWINTGQNISSAKSLRCEIWGHISRRDWKTRAMRPRQGMESCQKYLQTQRKGQSYILFAYPWVDHAGRNHQKTGG